MLFVIRQAEFCLLAIGTGVLAAFLISARLPRLRKALKARLPKSWQETYAPMLSRVRKTLGAWLKAQGKLLLVTYGVVGLGFLVLGIRRGLFWAALVSMVGTGGT